MMHYLLRHIEPGDMGRIIQRPTDWTAWSRPDEGRLDTVAMCMGDNVVALWWMAQRWAGVAELWGVVSDEAREHPRVFIRTCEVMLGNRMKDWGLLRVNTMVQTDNLEYRRFAEWMGFEAEFTMRHAGPAGVDMTGYVRWKGTTTRSCGKRTPAGGPTRPSGTRMN